jgi:hypothetical protein
MPDEDLINLEHTVPTHEAELDRQSNSQLMALCEATIRLYGINSANEGKMGSWQWNGFLN